jgi:hypothetical protein
MNGQFPGPSSEDTFTTYNNVILATIHSAQNIRRSHMTSLTVYINKEFDKKIFKSLKCTLKISKNFYCKCKSSSFVVYFVASGIEQKVI